jgi:hypothetical protein
MDPRRQTLFWTFEEYFDRSMGGRSVPVTLQYSFISEVPGFVQERLQHLTRGIVPASVDSAKAGKIKPDGEAPEPVDGNLMGSRILSDLVKEFGVLIRILRRMVPQERAVFILGRPPDSVKFVISHHRSCCAGFTHRARNSQDLPLLRAAIYEVTSEDHLPFGMPQNTFDFGVVELAQQAMQSVSVTMNVADEIVSLKSH